MKKYNFTALKKVELNPIVRKVWIATFLILLFFISILFLPWQQTVKGAGSVVAFDPTERDYVILATMDGFIEKFYVKENQFVKKGTPLFRMVDLDKTYLNRLENVESSTEEQVQNSKQMIVTTQERKANEKEYFKVGLSVYVQKKHQVENRIKSLRFKNVSLEKNEEMTKRNFNRVKLLYQDGIESRRKYEQAENTYIKARSELDKNQIDIQVQQTNISILSQEKMKFIKEMESKIKALDNTILMAKNSMKKLDQSLQKQATTIARYATSEVVAEKDGYVIRLLNNDKNKFIKKGEKVMQFSPKVTVRAVLLKVSDFNMPLIKEGLPVRIMFYGWPTLQISGWPAIKFGTFGGIIKRVQAISHEKGFYYAYVVEDPAEPWPADNILRLGTQATVWVRLSTVPIWYQVWRLMNALPPQMLTPADKE